MHFRLPLWQQCESKAHKIGEGAQNEGCPSGVSAETALGTLGQAVECATVCSSPVGFEDVWTSLGGRVNQPRLSGVFT